MLKIKIIISFLTLLFLGNLKAQEQDHKTSIYLKGNALLLPIAVVNVGLEHQLSKKYTLQGDVLISPWKLFAGHEFQYYSASFEGRYYFDEAFKHWYLGANISTAVFKLQKWNYWSGGTFTNEKGESFDYPNVYQKGFSIIFGITGGYQFKISDRWNIDLYATVGTSQDFYKGYERGTGRRYDEAIGFNKSGEILPYRGGVMISYKLK
ncbi:Protein of unknown function [Chryseobacterium sp. RU37D]|uniref:DUF3575 domain-containing protein n=1 Tax=Chryseobacterium sp. RU37D TaxID=1907397 RepID=UPI0009561290|nr:DUF3575 domain-containing protein [Chryseobacterium sp. RU37D]SIQ76084.1 Protein of unknown function [Chryseobacterium sp. RU37D]